MHHEELHKLFNDNIDFFKIAHVENDIMSFDVERSLENKNEDTIHKFKQIFGHTMQAYYSKDYKICFGKPIEFHNCKMVDTAKAYVIDSDDFTLKDV